MVQVVIDVWGHSCWHREEQTDRGIIFVATCSCGWGRESKYRSDIQVLMKSHEQANEDRTWHEIEVVVEARNWMGLHGNVQRSNK